MDECSRSKLPPNLIQRTRDIVDSGPDRMANSNQMTTTSRTRNTDRQRQDDNTSRAKAITSTSREEKDDNVKITRSTQTNPHILFIFLPPSPPHTHHHLTNPVVYTTKNQSLAPQRHSSLITGVHPGAQCHYITHPPPFPEFDCSSVPSTVGPPPSPARHPLCRMMCRWFHFSFELLAASLDRLGTACWSHKFTTTTTN